MTQAEIDSIDVLINKVKGLPELALKDEILNQLGNSADTERSIIFNDTLKGLYTDLNNIKKETDVTLGAVKDADPSFRTDLATINLFVRSDEYLKANQIWLEGRTALLDLLNRVQQSFTLRKKAEQEQNSLKTFLRSSAFKAVLIGTVITLVTGAFSKDYILEIIGKSKWNSFGADFANFEVLEHHRVVDLTQWTSSPDGDKESKTGLSIFDDYFTVRKIRNEGLKFCITAGSTGSNPRFSSLNGPVKTEIVDMQLVGWPTMQNQTIASLDVSDKKANTPFNIQLRSERYRGFSNENHEWCSVGIWHPTRKFIYTVKFPKNKLPKNVMIGTAFFSIKKNFIPLPSDSNLSVGGDSINWVIDHPIIGNAYKIEWDW